MTVPTPGELFGLQGKTALVTGASSGLGARFAAVLAAAGAIVWITARRKEKLDALAATNPALRVLPGDISDEETREALIAEIIADTGPVDVLVNNAGTESAAKPLDETPSGFAGVLGTNLVAPFHLAQLAARAADGKSLSVINVSSILGLVSAAPLGGASYASAKAGLIGLTRELAGHWGGRGVRVNALAPGWFHTEMNDELFADDQSVRWIERNTMLRRAGEGTELDGALLFLASAASSYCTGQVLAVDGGWTAR